MKQLTTTIMITTTHNMTDNYITLSVLSINISGISEEKKRNKLFDTLINKNRHNSNSRNTLCIKLDK